MSGLGFLLDSFYNDSMYKHPFQMFLARCLDLEILPALPKRNDFKTWCTIANFRYPSQTYGIRNFNQTFRNMFLLWRFKTISCILKMLRQMAESCYPANHSKPCVWSLKVSVNWGHACLSRCLAFWSCGHHLKASWCCMWIGCSIMDCKTTLHGMYT